MRCSEIAVKSVETVPPGFVIKSLAPSSRHSIVTAAPSVARLDKMTTGISQPRFLRSFKNSTPSITGISMSRIITSGFTSGILSTANCPFIAVAATCKPSIPSTMRVAKLRINAESSQISTSMSSILSSCFIYVPVRRYSIF